MQCQHQQDKSEEMNPEDMSSQHLDAIGGEQGKISFLKSSSPHFCMHRGRENQATEKMWCAYCGLWSDHQSGHCIQLFRDREKALNEEVIRLRKPRYPFQSFEQFCDFLTSNNIVDENAVCDPEGWDGGAELSLIEKAFTRALELTNEPETK